MPPNNNPLTREDRLKRVAAALLSGVSMRAIATQLSVNVGTIRRDRDIILRQWREERLENTDDWVTRELRQLDQSYMRVMKAAQQGELKAEEMLLKIHARRAALLGLDYSDRKVQQVSGDIRLIIEDATVTGISDGDDGE